MIPLLTFTLISTFYVGTQLGSLIEIVVSRTSNRRRLRHSVPLSRSTTLSLRPAALTPFVLVETVPRT